jgi:hypothetical protein
MIKNTFGNSLPILKIRTPFNFDVLKAMLRGNKKSEVGRGRFKQFPTSASEASNPQTVKRVR